MYGTNQEEWKPALAKDFASDQLPVSLGGSLVLDERDY
jgi:hypothetical protein